MAWFKVDDGFANSRPVLRIPRRYRAQAVGLWTLAGTWSAKELTDGFIPDYVLEELGGTPALAEHLVKCGLWIRVDGGYQFVGWAKYQPTKEQVLAHRRREAEKKQAARDAARKRYDQRESEPVPQGHPEGHMRESPGESLGESRLPDPTRPDPTRPSLSLVTSGGGVALVDAPEPPRICPRHEKWPGRIPKCGPCGDYRKAHEAWTAEQVRSRERAKASHTQAITDCPICDDRGLVETADNELTRCTHNTQGAVHA